jgi:hypothetical protein
MYNAQQLWWSSDKAILFSNHLDRRFIRRKLRQALSPGASAAEYRGNLFIRI